MAKKRNRKIFHVDMDQFFAAVEEKERPEIRGKLVCTGATREEDVYTVVDKLHKNLIEKDLIYTE